MSCVHVHVKRRRGADINVAVLACKQNCSRISPGFELVEMENSMCVCLCDKEEGILDSVLESTVCIDSF